MTLSVATNLSPQTHQQDTPPLSATTLVNPPLSRQPSTSSNKTKSPGARPRSSTLKSKSRVPVNQDAEESGWGSNFWVTLVDPQVCLHAFYGYLPFCNTKVLIRRAKHHFMLVQQPAKLDGIHQSEPSCMVYSFFCRFLLNSFKFSGYLPAKMANGGSFVMNLEGCLTTIKLKLGRPFGKSHKASLSLCRFCKRVFYYILSSFRTYPQLEQLYGPSFI